MFFTRKNKFPSSGNREEGFDPTEILLDLF